MSTGIWTSRGQKTTYDSLSVDLVIATRPNIVKAGPLYSELANVTWCKPNVTFLMQHTSPALASETLQDAGIPSEVVVHVPVHAHGYGLRLGQMIDAYAAHLARVRPGLVLVFGDVDATLAAALAAKRAQLPLVHIEAGLRSRDRSMPEEINRLMVDAVADLHFATTHDAVETLVQKEGHGPDTVHFVGNLMIDALVRSVDVACGEQICREYGLVSGQFGLVTFHRPANVDGREPLETLLAMLHIAASRLPLLFPVHPRTLAALDRHGLLDAARGVPGLTLVPALRYRDFVSVLSHARVVLTDSGGLQEETSVLGIPCLTVRANTERPVTVELGSNRLAEPEDVPGMLEDLLLAPLSRGADIPGWDGHAAERICAVLETWLPGPRK